MRETNYCNGDRKQSAWSRTFLPGRVLGLTCLLCVGVGSVGWGGHHTWTRLAQLEQEFRALEAESFYLGVRFRNGLEQLNGTLLRFQLTKADPDERDQFQDVARELSALLVRTQPYLATPEEQRLAQDLARAYETYLTRAASLLEEGVRAVRRDSAALVHAQIQELAAPLQPICQALVRAQNDSWKSFLNESEGVLAALRRSSQLSLLLLVAFSALIVWLAYRLMTAPLRAQLIATRAAMERQDKLAALGTLAAGIAHEIRNPLAALKFRLFSLKQSLPEPFANQEDVTVLGDEINRLERIIKEFLQFARPAEPALLRRPAQQLVQTVHALLRASLAKRGIELKLEPSATIWLRVDHQQIEQVLINLVQNAADSIASQGTVTLRVKQGAARLQNQSVPAVILEVADTGHGIPPEVQPRLFDPFFSTKDGGTGLGLPIAERIVEKHGGLLQYQTQPNRGTTFQVVLPRANDDATKSNHPAH